MKKIVSLILTFVILALSICIVPISAGAATSKENPISKEYVGIKSDSGGLTQYKVYKYTYKDRWTKAITLKGQDPGGVYLNKGDGLFYVDDNKGITASVSYGGLSIDVPLGRIGSKNIGAYKVAPKNGYYVLTSKRYVTPYAYYAVECRKRTNTFMPWGGWHKCNIVRSKGYTRIKSKPELKKVG